MAAVETASVKSFTHLLDYIRVNGVPGVLQSDSAEIIHASESNDTRDNKADSEEIQDLRSESGSNDGAVLIKLPYAGTNLTIQLLFYTHEPWMSPEMIFSDDHFSSTVTLKDLEEEVPSLNEWNVRVDDMLAQLVHQVLQLYRRHQLDRLEEEEFLQIQYQTLLKSLKIGEGDIEIFVSSAEQATTGSSILLRLPLSLQDVPPVLVDSNLGSPIILFQVDFPKKEGGTGGTFVPKLHLSPRVESLIGEACHLALPVVPPGTGLMDYVDGIMELLEDKVRKTILSFETRKQYIAEILCHFGCAVIEYDAERFSKIILMLEVKDFHFLTFITLGSAFPQHEGPKVLLQSVYHMNAMQPVSMELKDLQYNSQWKPEEMVQQTKDAILTNVSTFQMTSTRAS